MPKIVSVLSKPGSGPKDWKTVYPQLKSMGYTWPQVQNKESRAKIVKDLNKKIPKPSEKEMKKVMKNMKKMEAQMDKDDEEFIKPSKRLNKKTDLSSKGKKVKNRAGATKLKELLATIKDAKLKADGYYVVKVEFYKAPTKYFTLTPGKREKIINELLDLSMDKEFVEGHAFSDVSMHLKQGHVIKSFEVIEKNNFKSQQDAKHPQNLNRKTYKKRSGGFFPHAHVIDNDYVTEFLEKLQIFRDGVLPENPDVCFIHSLKGQIPDDLVDKLKFDVRTEYVPLTTIRKICENNNIYIKVRHERDGTNNNIVEYGSEDAEFKAEMCCIKKHYFPYVENTGITSYFLKNYDALKKLPDGHLFYRANKRTKDRFLNSFALVTELLKNEESLLVDASYDLVNCFKSVKIDDEELYDFNPEKCCRPISSDVKESREGVVRVYFDCETYTTQTMNHIPYLVSCIIGKKTKSFEGNRCFEEFMDYLAETYGSDTRFEAPELEMYAHNSTYDGSFLMKKLMNVQVLEKDNHYVSLKGVHCSWNKNRKFVKVLVKDSYRLIPMKLSKIPEACGFEDQAEKEVMYYNMYNYQTMDGIRHMSRKTMKKYINDFNDASHDSNKKLKEKKEQFYANLAKWDCINDDGTYDLMKYSRVYCEIDCKVLKMGMEKWYELFQQVDKRIDVFNFFSLPSLADYYWRITGCYEGCMQFNGALGAFFQNFVHGGRVMTRRNMKQKLLERTQDFDAVSLYPSAMRLFPGYLKGCPKRIETTDYEELKRYDGLFVKVLITGVGKKQPIPTMCYKDKETGGKEWTNEMVGRTLFMDNIALEDAIEFHKIEFEIIDGYYFNEGFNTKIKKQIKKVFNKRLEAKEAGNEGLQQVYKLVLNSSYGKLIQKSNTVDIKYLNRKDLLHHVTRNYNEIKAWTDVPTSRYLRMETYKSLDESWSSPHMGSQVLSYSKRLVNRVICTAHDIGVRVHYTDTDSIHLPEAGVEPLAAEYSKRYGGELIGKKLGQFHCDFELKIDGVKMKDVVSLGLITLGKKSYIDRLEGVDKNGVKQQGYHIRLKGISEDAINDHVRSVQKEDETYDEWKMFEKLYRGEAITFNLAVNNKCRFEKSKGQEYKTCVGDFTRKVQF